MKIIKEKLAIIGIGCRFPGDVGGPDDLWDLIINKQDATREVPNDRWNKEAFYHSCTDITGKIKPKRGGFIDTPDKFDASFFNISPMEACQMDPQHRMLLEVSYEALEDAGIPLHELAGQTAGVFVGITSHDYWDIQVKNLRPGIYTYTGNAFFAAVNRLSYFLDVHGPSVAIDTACSSSLTALHYACQSIWNDECRLALVGGCNFILNPDITAGLGIVGVLASDGRCKAFDASADGFARSEGVGIVVVKPLSKALRAGDKIYSVINDILIAQDGRTQGMSLPNPVAQANMLETIYKRAHINPCEINYVEAHGTGTQAGDSAETKAIGSVFSRGRASNKPCHIGSVKTNIGHTEAAAGIAGLIKASLAVQKGIIPPNINLSQPNPAIAFEQNNLKVPVSAIPWPEDDRQRYAGVNSFGMGGVNAHVIIQAPPDGITSAHDLSENSESLFFPVSANTAQALHDTLERYHQYLDSTDADLRDVAYTLLSRRTFFPYRLGITASDKSTLLEKFRIKLEAGKESFKPVNTQKEEKPQLAWVFSGQGPQWWKMGRELLEQSALFREVIFECDRLLSQYCEWSLFEELSRPEAESRINETDIAQPALFAVQLGLAKLWNSMGVYPDAVVGHSVGEVAASVVTGVYTVEQATEIIYLRSSLQHRACGLGRMLAVELSVQAVTPYLEGLTDKVSIAAINGPSSLTLAGCAETLKQLKEKFDPSGIFNKFINIDYAFHCYQMDFLKTELLESFEKLEGKQPNIPLWSTVTGQKMEKCIFDAQYWWRNVRKPVQFAKAINGMISSGIRHFLEIGPHPVLARNVTSCLAERNVNGSVGHSLHRKKPELTNLYRNREALFENGCNLCWPQQLPPAKFIKLPPYPWQKERHWKESENSKAYRLGHPLHAFLRYPLDSACATWQGTINPLEFPYLTGHRVDKQVVLPGAAYVDMALALGKDFTGTSAFAVKFIRFHQVLSLIEAVDVQANIDSTGQFSIYTRDQNQSSDWCLRATGSIEEAGSVTPGSLPIEEIKNRLLHRVSKPEVYQAFTLADLDYSDSFQAIETLYTDSTESLAFITDLTEHDSYGQFHPALLDACFQSMLGFQIFGQKTQSLYFPVDIDFFYLHEKPAGNLWSYCKLTNRNESVIEGNILICDLNGKIVAKVRGLHCQAVGRTKYNQHIQDLLYQYGWHRSSRRLPMGISNIATDNEDNPSLELQNVYSGSFNHESRKAYYEKIEPVLEELTCHYLVSALDKMGFLEQKGGFNVEQILEQGNVLPKYRRFVERCLQILEEVNIAVRQDENEWHLTENCQKLLGREFLSDRLTSPALDPYRIKVELLSLCGDHLVEVLTGKRDPVDLIFSEARITQYLYQSSPTSVIYNELAQSTLEAILQQRIIEGKTLRILEVGAGTGGTTAYLAKSLAEHHAKLGLNGQETTDYIFTDVSPAFLSKAQDKFSEYPFISFEILNLEQSPELQGFEPASFDLVVAANVIHATQDIAAALSHINQVIAPGGALILVELTRPMKLFELVFGLTDGWWRFTDMPLRQSHPLLSNQQWSSLLENAGFENFHCINENSLGLSVNPVQSVLVAQQPVINHQPALQVGHWAKKDTWLLLVNDDNLSASLINTLQAQGKQCICLYRGEYFDQKEPMCFVIRPHLKEDWQRFIDACDGAGTITSVVYLWSLTEIDEQQSVDILGAQAYESCYSVLHLLHCLLQLRSHPLSLLAFVFEHVHVTSESDKLCRIFHAPLWGLCRTLSNEYPEYHCRLIDIDEPDKSLSYSLLLDELMAVDDEREVAYRKGRRYVHRLQKIEQRDPQPIVTKNIEYCLDTKHPGVLENLYFKEIDRPTPNDREVSVKISASGMNFRDVMKAMGIYPGDGSEPFFLGDEFAGTVTAVGDGVTDLKIGDEVIGFGHFTLASSVVTKADFVIKKPERFSMTEAATFPIAYLTVLYSLEYMARLQEGEKILIHAAAGGIGLTAVQYAQLIGAEIFATAGTPEKREYLRSLGVQHVFDSRSLSFYEEIYQVTGGEGVNVVLNSLSGQAMMKSIDLLGEYGRFVELGTRDIYDNHHIGLRALRKNITYHTVDMSRIFTVKPKLVKTLINRFHKFTDHADFKPIYHQTYSIAGATDAFRTMAQSAHQGKIVLQMESQQVPVTPGPKEIRIGSDRAYVITGGLGGFGILVSGWLAKLGAGKLILMGRHTESLSSATQQKLEEIRKLGSDVTLFQGDVRSQEDIKQLIKTAQQHHKIGGIFHLAMVLDDALLSQMTGEQLYKAMAPKIQGAWNLHNASTSLPLDYFVMFSSITSIFGLPGQANYIAGNYFLDKLSEYRKLSGLPSTTVNWGVLSQIGYVANKRDVLEELRRQGHNTISPSEALKILEVAMSLELPQVGVVKLDRERWLKNSHVSTNAPQFQELLDGHMESRSFSGKDSVKSLLSMTEDERQKVVEERLIEMVSKVLCIDQINFDINVPLTNIGLDSLVTVEIRNWIQKSFGVEVSLIEIMKGVSFVDLARSINRSIIGLWGPFV